MGIPLGEYAVKPLLAYVLACGCICCDGQTNSCAPARIQFFEPSIQLRQQFQTEPPKQSSQQLHSSSSLPQTVVIQKMAVTSAASENDLHSRFIRPGEFYLTQTEPQFNNGAERFVDQIFRPEVFHVGKIPVSCSFWTAIKRKNPLCLLNPIVLQASW